MGLLYEKQLDAAHMEIMKLLGTRSVSDTIFGKQEAVTYCLLGLLISDTPYSRYIVL